MNVLIFFLPFLAIFSASADELLYLGDSHSHIYVQDPEPENRRFGNILIDGLAGKGDTVSYYAACGSAPQNWIKGGSTPCGYTAFSNGKFISLSNSSFPSITTLYNPQKHSRIILNFGDNMFDWKSVSGKRLAGFNKSFFDSSMKSFLKLLPDITPHNCLWIGPTYHIEGKYYRKPNAVVDLFYENLETSLKEKCSIIDSRPLVNTTVPNDGLHHVNSDSQQWADGVLNLL